MCVVAMIDQKQCEHDWKIWPETDGKSQRCTKCGSYRDTPSGLDPTTNDIGRLVVYKARHPNAEPEQGVITSFNEHCVFVRYGADVYSKGTSREDLEWCNK